MKIFNDTPEEERKKWKIVRMDNLEDVPCVIIVTADEDTGECVVYVDGTNKSLNFGQRGFKIVLKGR